MILPFTEIITPMATEEFILHYWDKQALFSKNADRQFSRKLGLSTRQISQRLFTGKQLQNIPFKLYNGKEEVHIPQAHNIDLPFDGFSTQGLYLDALFQILNRENSFHLHFAENFFPLLKQFCQQLEQELKVHALSHLILSPPNARGLLPHTDPYGVFVLQLYGEKKWFLYDIPVSPAPAQGINYHHYADRQPNQLFKLQAGDLLYIPKGMVHATETEDQHAVHLSLGLIPAIAANALELIFKSMTTQTFFQQYLPFGMLGSIGDPVEFQRSFKDQVQAYIKKTDIFTLLDNALQQRIV